jgi:hypothetical protein
MNSWDQIIFNAEIKKNAFATVDKEKRFVGKKNESFI